MEMILPAGFSTLRFLEYDILNFRRGLCTSAARSIRTSKYSSGQGRAPMSPARFLASSPLAVSSSRAFATAVGDASIPKGRNPSSARNRRLFPVPQPSSRTRIACRSPVPAARRTRDTIWVCGQRLICRPRAYTSVSQAFGAVPQGLHRYRVPSIVKYNSARAPKACLSAARRGLLAPLKSKMLLPRDRACKMPCQVVQADRPRSRQLFSGYAEDVVGLVAAVE